MRQKQAEGRNLPVGSMALELFGLLEGAEEDFEIEKHFKTNLMTAFAKKDAATSSGGKK